LDVEEEAAGSPLVRPVNLPWLLDVLESHIQIRLTCIEFASYEIEE